MSAEAEAGLLDDEGPSVFYSTDRVAAVCASCGNFATRIAVSITEAWEGPIDDRCVSGRLTEVRYACAAHWDEVSNELLVRRRVGSEPHAVSSRYRPDRLAMKVSRGVQ